VDVLARKSRDFIQRAAAERAPFFLMVTPFKPHLPGTPPRRYAKLFRGLKAPRTASFDEADVSDKPAWIRKRNRLRKKDISRIDEVYRGRKQSMLAIRDLVETVVRALDDAGVTENTYLVFASDNGYHLGQHRLRPGKDTCYEEDLSVPMVIRGPGIPAGKTIRALTANVDYAPTFLDWAGLDADTTMDGRSLDPLLTGAPKPGAWREAVLLEHKALAPTPTTQPSGILEYPDPGTKGPIFTGVRTLRYTYVEFVDGERELYDNEKDPDQLNNLADRDLPIMAKLQAHLARLRACVGRACW